MEWLGLFVAAILFVGLLQLFAFFRTRGWGSQTEGDSDQQTDQQPDLLSGLDTTALDGETGTTPDHERICPQCGTTNESGYTYCRQCIGYLHSAGQQRHRM